jgi:hypothetical protein
MQSVTATGNTLTVTYNLNINTADLQADGSQFVIAIGTGTSATTTARAWGAGSQVFLDMPNEQAAGTNITVTAQDGKNGRTVCAANSTQACEATGDSQSATEAAPSGVAPKIQAAGVVASASNQTVTVTYNEAIDCATLDPSAKQFSGSTQGPGNGAPNQAAGPVGFSKAACGGSGPTSSQVILSQGAPLVPGATVTIVYSSETPSSSNGNIGPIVGNDQSEPDGDTGSAQVGQ